MVQLQSRGTHSMTMHLALVYTCTFDEAWLRARFVTRSRVECWTLRCTERRNMATPSAIDLLVRSFGSSWLKALLARAAQRLPLIFSLVASGIASTSLCCLLLERAISSTVCAARLACRSLLSLSA
jgi:hypothetical protein